MFDRVNVTTSIQSDLTTLYQKIDQLKETSSKEENTLLAELKKKLATLDLDEQLNAVKIIYSILQHPPELDETAYARFTTSIKSKPQNFIGKLLHPSSSIIESLDAYLLKVLGLKEQELLLNDKSMKLLNTVTSHERNHYYHIVQDFLHEIDGLVLQKRPKTISPATILPYLQYLKGANEYLDKLKEAIPNPIASALREDDLKLPESLNAKNSIGRNEYQFDYFIGEMKSERLKIAKQFYANVMQFLEMKDKLRAFAKNKYLMLWSSCENFCDYPCLKNLDTLTLHINLEKRLCSYTDRKMLDKFLKEAEEISYSYHFNHLSTQLQKLSPHDDTRLAGKRCLDDINDLKQKHRAPTTFLTDKLATISSAIERPHSANNMLAEKAKEVMRSGLKVLGGSLLCLLSTAMLVTAAYVTVQTAFIAWPITLATSKAALAIMGIGIAMTTAGAISLAKSAHFLAQARKEPELKTDMQTLHDAIQHQPPRPRG